MTTTLRASRRHLPVLTMSVVGSLGVRFLTTVAIARFLGPAVAGGYAAISTAVEIGDRVFAGGRPPAIAYHTAAGTPAGPMLADSFTFLRRQTFLATLAGLAFAALPAIRELGPPVAAAGALTIAALPVTASAKSCWRELRLARGDSHRVGAMEMLRAAMAIGFGAAAIGVAQVAGTPAAVVVLFAGYPITELAARRYLRVPELEVAPGKVPEAFGSYARSSYGGAVAQPLNQRLDQLLLAALVPAASVGLYATAASLSLIIGVFGIAATWAMYPNLSNARLSETAARRAGARLSGMLLIVVLPLATVLIAFAEPVVRLVFGTDFLGAVAATRILAAAAVLTCLNQVGHITLLAMGRPNQATRAQLTGLGLQLPAAVGLGLQYGIEGVAWASAGAYGLRLAMTWSALATRSRQDRR